MKKITVFVNWLQKHHCLTAMVSGIMFSLPFLLSQLFIFSFISISLFVISLFDKRRPNEDNIFQHKNNLRDPFLTMFLFGLGFFIPLYHWFIALYPFNGFGLSPIQGIFVVFIACVGISLLHAFIYALLMKLLAKINPQIAFFPFFLSAMWVFSEWILAQSELGFSWGITALSQIGFLPMVQTVSLFGSYFITIIVVSSGAYIGLALMYPKRLKVFLPISLSLIAFNLITGTFIYLSPEKTDTSLSAVVLQANISSSEKWENEGQSSKDAYLQLLSESLDKFEPDIILFPESAFPFAYTENSILRNNLQDISTENDVIIILGALTEENDKTYNSLVAIYPDGSDSVIYNKRSLAPFGEFLPYKGFFESIMPFLSHMNLYENEITAGVGSNLLDSKYGSLGNLICFDSIFQENARKSTTDGARIFMLATNDSWYRDSAAVRQHADFARLRAIENGRYVVRAANTGISMFIDTKGNILTSLPVLEAGIIESKVMLSDHITPYTLYGDTALYFSFVIIILSIISYIVYNTKNKKRSLKQ